MKARIDHELLPELSGAGANIVFIDPPDHPNVGDSAIFLGEIDFLRRAVPTANMLYFDRHSFSDAALPIIERADLIFLHGGGNFGDIWPSHHRLRMSILSQFPHKRIVQFPQSIHFQDEATLSETARLIEKASQFTLLTRDVYSMQYAEQRFQCRIKLCPDMAFAMKEIRRKRAIVRYLCLLRTDKEVATNHQAVISALSEEEQRYELVDWLSEQNTVTKRADKLMRKIYRRSSDAMYLAGHLAFRARERYARSRLGVGISLLSRGETVITDRLHGYIISTLLDIPSLVFDSYDGKIFSFHRTWMHDSPKARIMTSIEEFRKTIYEAKN
ncbi:polysaccharide pyruvyl transferase family protein [Nostoc sp. NIES-2111]